MTVQTFYLLAGALTVIACLAVLLPFLRQQGGGRGQASDIDVYRQQLAELEADRARGLIGAAEAEEARAELGRRILGAAASGAEPKSPPTAGRWAIVIAVALIPPLSLGLYWLAGSPGLPDQPLAARLQGNPAGSTIEELVARTERHLAENPEDGIGWSVIAPVYLRLGRDEDAVRAWKRAIELLGEDPARLSGLGEALASVDAGRIGPESRQQFERALALDPDHEKARFYLGLAHAQAGEREEAAKIWTEMTEIKDTDSPWRELAARALDKLAQSGQQTEPDPQQEMIEGMVRSLAERLEREPEDPDGWERLVRSYIVLGRREDAAAALERARAALAGDAASAARLEALQRQLTGG